MFWTANGCPYSVRHNSSITSPINQNLKYKRPHAEAAVWLPLAPARERYFGGEPIAKSEFAIQLRGEDI
jgi:hypothetical protein